MKEYPLARVAEAFRESKPVSVYDAGKRIGVVLPDMAFQVLLRAVQSGAQAQGGPLWLKHFGFKG